MTDLDALLHVDDRWNAAYHRGDPDLLGGVLAPDWLGFFPDGTAVTRPQLLTHFPRDPSPTLLFERHAARVHGHTGVTRVSLYDGARRVQSVLRVYACRDGQWQAVSAQVVG
ncbi:nuclear transport factor 2 family protein [Deinococcus taeanensis]|uniref:nuclear transport factor 2 family protein n=1 Tax=Deinococcus taeanensis TaxID=2737050 RepID=UPI001CDC1FA5|nr:nuclear transport factor 2 family protein [Deinococcus taeanensis]UBV42739.1 nuclear transport factor 2 family protein [Deinococcus taeanensis]